MVVPDPLQALARLYNLQTSYYDGLGQLRKAPPEAILSVLKSLGAAVESLADGPGALRARRQALWQQVIEPVTVAWQDRPFKIKLRLPCQTADRPVAGEIILENGVRIDCRFAEATGQPLVREVEGIRYITRGLVLQEQLPFGYHRLYLRIDDLNLDSHLIVAPYQAYNPPEAAKHWGVFCPLYALHSAQSWGSGDMADLAHLARFAGELGGHMVATLPMLAGHLDEPFNPSPYAPVSRLFWNEFYLDVTKIPEFAASPRAQARMASAEFRRALHAVRAQSLVDYRRVMALKRAVIEELREFFLATSTERCESFETFVAAQPRLQDYAAFRAKGEREQRTWQHWPDADRREAFPLNGYDEGARSYHLYAQWLCDEQAHWLRNECKQAGTALYLDFPLGVNRDGYDVWRERDLFVLGASAGAPPDGLFVKGQNWGFPPHHPGAIRSEGYRYFRDCLQHHMALASMLRIDHVMGLHRAFWVPEDFSAAEGLYVHNRADEYYAILSLESHRHHVQIVGENLGTVPPYVNDALARHGILGMYVAQFAVGTDPANALEPPPLNTVASLNTHDTATFMSFWTGADIDDRSALGLLDQVQAQHEHGYRAAQRHALTGYLRATGRLEEDASPAAVLAAWLGYLASGAADFLLVNLEDLWLEVEPQNVPGTWQERPNWQRKARFDLAEIRAMPKLVELLRNIGDIRRRMS